MSDRTICGYPVHEAAELFPIITGPDFDALVEDIRSNGLHDPVVLDTEGRIIDGRNRARACERIGLRPQTITYKGDDVLQFVVSHNLHRRHLTDSQRAMIAAKLATRPTGRNSRFVCNIAHDDLTRSEAATLLQVSPRAVASAKKVTEDGTPELQELVAQGEVSLGTAVRVSAELTPAEQTGYVESVRGGADPIEAAPPTSAAKREAERKRAGHPDRSEFHRGARHIDPERVIDETVSMLEGIATGLEVIKGVTATLPIEKRTAWLSALDGPLKAINTFRKELSQ